MRWRLVALVLATAVTVGSASSHGVPVQMADRPPRPPLPEPVEAHEIRGDLLLVPGVGGTAEYAREFRRWAAQLTEAAQRGGWRVSTLGGDADGATASEFREWLDEHGSSSETPLWIILIGHGTFDGRDAKFNLAGDDISGEDLAGWLSSLSRPLAIINTSSASGPMLAELSAPGRVVVTATRSGEQVNFARFGGYFAAAWSDPTADLDKDEQVSLLEAFLHASRQTEQFYATDNRIPTEQALIDDTGDGRGSRADRFDGVRPRVDEGDTAEPDGLLANQWWLIPSPFERSFPSELGGRRDAIELEILRLRERKETMPEEEYYRELESLLVEFATLYAEAEQASSAAAGERDGR